MESSDAVAGLEFVDIGADLFDDAGDIIALVDGVIGTEVGEFPVFWVGAGDDDADEDVVRGGKGGDWDGGDGDAGALVDGGGEHCFGHFGYLEGVLDLESVGKIRVFGGEIGDIPMDFIPDGKNDDAKWHPACPSPLPPKIGEIHRSVVTTRHRGFLVLAD